MGSGATLWAVSDGIIFRNPYLSQLVMKNKLLDSLERYSQAILTKPRKQIPLDIKGATEGQTLVCICQELVHWFVSKKLGSFRGQVNLVRAVTCKMALRFVEEVQAGTMPPVTCKMALSVAEELKTGVLYHRQSLVVRRNLQPDRPIKSRNRNIPSKLD